MSVVVQLHYAPCMSVVVQLHCAPCMSVVVQLHYAPCMSVVARAFFSFFSFFAEICSAFFLFVISKHFEIVFGLEIVNRGAQLFICSFFCDVKCFPMYLIVMTLGDDN